LAQSPDLVSEAVKIVDSLQSAGLVARILGATAVRIHAHDYLNLHKALGRELSDLDFVAYGRQRDEIERHFAQELKFKMITAAVTPGLFMDRCIFFDESGSRRVDVFLDKLQMNHTIDFRNRLETSYPTIPLTELLLEKLQIVKINEKDVKDTIVLFLAHEVGESGEETIDANYVSKLLSNDWGFYYTVSANLEKVRTLAQGYSALTDKNKSVISSRIGKLLYHIEEQPKSLRWKLRARIGTSQRWYNEVEEVERAEWLRDIVLKKE
jgi:hypothetical protein